MLTFCNDYTYRCGILYDATDSGERYSVTYLGYIDLNYYYEVDNWYYK